MKYDLKKFEAGLKELNLILSENQINQFMTYYEMLIEKNKVMNLTAITEYEEVIEKHFLDSLSLCKHFQLDKNLSVLDLGTGAGFPGIPLKLAFPDLEMTLVDSLNKRVFFLQEVISSLNINNIRVIHSRAEEIGKNNKYREKYDLCVSRAVANLASLSEYCLPFVKPGGFFISYKSGNIEDELLASEKAISVLGGSLKEVLKFQLPNTEISRSFVMIEKIKHTPKNYPRKAGTPSKEPIR